MPPDTTPGSGAVGVRAAPLSAWDDYCEDMPFLDQPTAATCSAMLIDDDLVLTAGHCLDDVPSCRDYAYVFDYLYAAPAELGPIERGAVFGCKAVAVRETSPPDAVEHVDFAVVQLDRGAGRLPAPVSARSAFRPGDALRVIGFPSGLPAKIDAGARVVDARLDSGDFFTLASDTFRGSSGSAVYDPDETVAGVFARGTSDFVDAGGCRVLRKLPADAPTSGESATYAARAVEALCAAGWPSERLCGITSRCGDGVCSSAAANPETSDGCPADCAPATCGDGLCETGEFAPTDVVQSRIYGAPASSRQFLFGTGWPASQARTPFPMRGAREIEAQPSPASSNILLFASSHSQSRCV